MDETLREVLLKTEPELSDVDHQLLIDNKAQLGEEDIAAYSFLNEEAPTPEVPATPEAPKAEPFVFKSEAEAQEFVRKQAEESEKAKQAAIAAANTPDEKRYVEENWKPKDWNEGMKKAVEFAKAEIKQEQEEKDKKAAYDYWDKQWKELSAEKKIPELTTPEGRKIHNEIIHLMQARGLKTFKEGYDMNEKLTAVISGQPAISASEAGSALAKSRIDAQKKAATKIGKANAGDEKTATPTGIKPFDSYEELKKTNSRGILKGL